MLSSLFDKETRVRKRGVLAVLVLSTLLGLSPLAADPTIRRGIDVFTTRADGRTYHDFAQQPIPAGFFCNASKAFTGRVALKGLPLATQTPGQLRNTDTIVERLDDAVFNARGVAETRVRFRAVSLVSIAPIKTACGDFHVYVTLNGPQRVTTMSINRTQSGGGTFSAPLAVNARMTFIPVKKPVKSATGRSARKWELTASFTFPATLVPWSLGNEATMKRISSAVVDTNGDLTPDTRLPGTSNFVAGLPPVHVITGAYGNIGACPCEPVCHSADGEMHCTYIEDNCYPVVCGG
jgi:hypothetical protein